MLPIDLDNIKFDCNSLVYIKDNRVIARHAYSVYSPLKQSVVSKFDADMIWRFSSRASGSSMSYLFKVYRKGANGAWVLSQHHQSFDIDHDFTNEYLQALSGSSLKPVAKKRRGAKAPISAADVGLAGRELAPTTRVELCSVNFVVYVPLFLTNDRSSFTHMTFWGGDMSALAIWNLLPRREYSNGMKPNGGAQIRLESFVGKPSFRYTFMLYDESAKFVRRSGRFELDVDISIDKPWSSAPAVADFSAGLFNSWVRECNPGYLR